MAGSGPGSQPTRVVSLCPSNTELAVTLGCADRLVGADRWSLRDPHLRLPDAIADVGADLSADMDRVAALSPDLVLASRSVPGMERNVEELERRGLPHVVVPSGDWQGVRRATAVVASALGVPERGERLLREMDVAWERARRLAAERASRRLRVAWEWWPKPVIVAGRRSWVHDMLEALGMENAFSDLDRESGPVEAREVAGRRPDAVCLCWCGTAERRMNVAEVAGRPGWAQLPAVKERRVYLLPENPFGRPGPGLARGLEMLARLFHGSSEERAVAQRDAARAAGLAEGALAWPA